MATSVQLRVNGVDVPEISGFTFSDDILAVGEESAITVINERGKYTSGLKRGSFVEVCWQSPEFNGGNPVLRFVGRLLDRKPKVTPSVGSVIELTVADLGAHLTMSCAPLWWRFDRTTFGQLCNPAEFTTDRAGRKIHFIDNSFGLKGLRTEANTSRRLRLGVAAAAAAAQRELDPVLDFSVQPGEKIWDKITLYAKRFGYLVNVSPDGWIQVFRPNYNQKPLYRIRHRVGDAANNVLEAEGYESCRTLYTDTEVVGHIVGQAMHNDPNNVHEGSIRGSYVHTELLPFTNKNHLADSEMYTKNLCEQLAKNLYERGLWDSFYVNYKVAGHGQNGNFYTPDTIIDCDDDELGIHGPLYLAAVKTTVELGTGEVSYLTCRYPGLLSGGIEVPTPSIRRLTEHNSKPSGGG